MRSAETTRHRFNPTAPATAVNTLLTRLGLGALPADGLTSYGGRNTNWAGTTGTGEAVFVKHFTDPAALRRAVAFEELSAGRIPAPRCLGWSEVDGLQVFELLTGSRSGAELVQDGLFDEHLSARAGSLLAQVHSLDGPELEATPPQLPSLELLAALPLAVLGELSMAQLQAWALMQEDAAFLAAVHRLRALEAAAPRVPAHTDLRLDQFVLAGDELRLLDWEEFRLADAARDVGAFLGEWLFQATFKIMDSEAPELRHEDIVQRGVTAFRGYRGRLEAFWRAYLDRRGAVDPGFTERAAGFAGWQLFERLLSIGRERSVLSPIARAAAGVGRTVLLHPRATTGLLGLSTSDTEVTT
ncbi:class V lanthionine synthetase subunit LxmK [Crossiella cryophila]|uniref:Aminoglycoside phosphotransferase domain-containing protein n=1 Tax=Crossiella cryophila TaxID=43355 RepID=A0A7W7FYR4_9PSEU|nr:class V lanthionine synthetase subunit LxmK [Crossiella cryophila]MBB4680319.1 hypothetical protein [Crossiella cryophila]